MNPFTTKRKKYGILFKIKVQKFCDQYAGIIHNLCVTNHSRPTDHYFFNTITITFRQKDNKKICSFSFCHLAALLYFINFKNVKNLNILI